MLVAPWLDPKKVIDPNFFQFDINPKIVALTDRLIIVYSTDDDREILSTIETLKAKLPSAEFKEFKGKGHFVLSSLKSDKFPELLDLLID